MARILIVDDDAHIRDVLRFALEKEEHDVFEASDGKDGLAAFESLKPDLIVLDVMMPEMDGTDVCREIRKSSAVPILFLSARDDEIDRIIGLEIGGDDYLSKPFSPREMTARVKAILRRGGPAETADSSKPDGDWLTHGRLKLELSSHRAFWEEQEVELTVTEFGLLRVLIQRPGKVYKRENLMEQAYDVARVVSDRTIDSHIRRVRRKFSDIGAEPIQTTHGLGYKLGPC